MSVIDSIRFPLYVIDVETFQIVLANRAACVNELPHSPTCYALTHLRSSPCDDEAGPCPLQEVRTTKQPMVVEHVHYDRNGAARCIEVHAFPIFDDAGNVVQMVEYNVDITEQKRAAEKLQNHERSLEMLVQQLARSNQELQRFASVAAHDIRSPMAGVLSAAFLLKEMLGNTLEGEAKDILDVLMRGVEKAAQMVTSLYRCAQVDAGEITPKNVDLSRVAQELSDVQLRAELERTRGQIQVPEPLHAVLGDELQISELMQNLIANALKYNRPGIAPHVIIRSREVGDRWIRIEVADNGSGIPATDLEKIFEMFHRATSDHEGLGIGLAFCRKVAERHGGRIGVQSAYGAGSTFWVELPRA
jgi:signal transduction histidine kinase